MYRRAFAVALGLVVAVATAWALEGELVSVAVRSAQLREASGHLAPIVARLAYTDEVEVLEMRGDFLRVASSEGEGWLHKSAISEDKIVLEDDGEDAARRADDREVALAGRGFNEQVEERYRSEQGLRFDGVDLMEARVRDSDTLMRFIEEGGLPIPGDES